MTLALYILTAFALLAALARVILTLGRRAATGPGQGQTAPAVALTTEAGFLSIGAGIVLIIAAAMTLFGAGLVNLLFATGLASLTLGLSFLQAAAQLRAALHPKPVA